MHRTLVCKETGTALGENGLIGKAPDGQWTFLIKDIVLFFWSLRFFYQQDYSVHLIV